MPGNPDAYVNRTYDQTVRSAGRSSGAITQRQAGTNVDGGPAGST